MVAAVWAVIVVVALQAGGFVLARASNYSLCDDPFMSGSIGHPCGRCVPCTIRKKRLWTSRQVLESFCHDASCFVTLTYDQENLPEGLRPKHLQKFLKRFREQLRSKYGTSVRFYGVGEYGDISGRPHYHLSIFGVGQETADLVQKAWKRGFTQVAEFNPQTAAYVAGYVTKKMTKVHAASKQKEFTRMSLRPGIGALAMPVVADAILTEHGLKQYERDGDVPKSLKMGSNELQLGRYLRSFLRKQIGVSDEMVEQIKTRWSMEVSNEMSSLRFLARDMETEFSPKAHILRSTLQPRRNVAARHKIFEGKSSL